MTRRYHSEHRADAAQKTRQAILAAFAAQLGRPGTFEVSVPEAADVAGVSVRTVYHHFPDDAARRGALAAWLEDQLTSAVVLPELTSAADLPGLTRALYAAAAANEALMRAQAAAGFATPVRLERLALRRARIAEVLTAVGAPAVETQRATAAVMVLMSAEAGLPLVDIHGLTIAEAGETATQAVAAVVADLQQRAGEPDGGPPTANGPTSTPRSGAARPPGSSEPQRTLSPRRGPRSANPS